MESPVETVVGAEDVDHPAVRSSRAWMMAWISLFLIDAALLVGNVLHTTVNGPGEPRHRLLSRLAWSGERDGSYAELFGHIQLIVACVVLVFVWLGRRTAVYLAWTVVLLTVVADDLFMLHEAGGLMLSSAYDFPAVAGMRPQDLGELLTWALFGVVLGPMLLVTHLRAHEPHRRNSLRLVGALALLAVFAVVVDMLHIMVDGYVPRWANTGLTLLETAGELCVMSVMLIVVLRMALMRAGGSDSAMLVEGRHPRRPRQPSVLQHERVTADPFQPA